MTPLRLRRISSSGESYSKNRLGVMHQWSVIQVLVVEESHGLFHQCAPVILEVVRQTLPAEALLAVHDVRVGAKTLFIWLLLRFDHARVEVTRHVPEESAHRTERVVVRVLDRDDMPFVFHLHFQPVEYVPCQVLNGCLWASPQHAVYE